MSSSEIIKNAEAIIAIDARGFIFGSAIFRSIKTNDCSKSLGSFQENYLKRSIVWSMVKIRFQFKKALNKYSSFAIIDDLLATGGTVNCVSNILKNNHKKITDF